MLKIVPAYQGMAAYIAAVRANPNDDPRTPWQREVIQSSWQDWAAGEFNEERVREQLSRPYTDLAGLEREIAGLASSGIEAVIRTTYARIAALLPYHAEDVAVCILAADPLDRGLVENLQGVVGSCVGGNTLLTVNPAGADWLAMAAYVLAHERHHSAWGYHHYVLNHELQPCLLASLVSEGSADVFAHQLCPGLHPAWTDALNGPQEADQWAAIAPLLFTPDFDGALHRRFIFGDPASGTPPFTGYTIGYHIVQGYVSRHPSEPVASWTLRSPREILAGSGYPD